MENQGVGLTPERVKAAYQNAIPRRRDDFAGRLQSLFQAATRRPGYMQTFPLEVTRAAIAEVRERHELAATRIKDMLDDGWRPPHPRTVRDTYLDMFTLYDRMDKDSFSDLTACIPKAFDNIGRHDPAEQLRLERLFSDKQVRSAEEHLSDLDCYVPRGRGVQAVTVYNNAPVSAQQIGQGNVANLGSPTREPQGD